MLARYAGLLVVTLGIPTGTVWAGIISAKPAQVVAIIAPRQRAALQRLAGESLVVPFAARSAVLKARAYDARARAELRDLLSAGVPQREVLALEPLLGEFEGLEIAAAALKLLERTRAAQDDLVKAAEIRVRTIMKEAMAEKEASREQGEREDRGERTERPREFAPRTGAGASGPRSTLFSTFSSKSALCPNPRPLPTCSSVPDGWPPQGNVPRP